MKIGFCRLGAPIEINVKQGSIATLGTEIREGLMHDWLELGYEVSIISEIKKSDVGLINAPSLFSSNWFKKLKYTPVEPPNDLDVVFIECGSTNPLYKGEFGSYAKKIEEIVNKVNCKIVYYQHGHLEWRWLNKITKPVLILHHFRNEEEFIKEFKYDKTNPNLSFKYIPLGYSKIDITYAPKEKPTYDLIWIGGENDSNKNKTTKENTRAPLIEKYFKNTSYNSVVIGKWSEETKKRLNGVKFLGALGKHGDAYKFFNDSYLTLWGGSISTKRLGLIPSRPIMALLSGSAVVSEKDMYKIEELIIPLFLINSQKDVENILMNIKLLGCEARKDFCEESLLKFPLWKDINWEGIFK